MSGVLVTGASGFIGGCAVDALLSQGAEVHAVARHAGAARAGVSWHEADLLEPAAAAEVVRATRPERLLHLAWYAKPGSFWTASENELWVDASVRLLRAFAAGGGRRATIAGTCAEYQWGDQPLREQSTPLRPATLYGRCKLAAHAATEQVAAELDVSLAWGRVFFLYGPGEAPDRLVSSVARALVAGEEVATTDGLQRRDFMHVADVGGALVALLASNVAGAVNIASGEAVAVREVVSRIAAEAGGIERVRFGALPARAGEPPVIAADARRLGEEVGFRARFDLEQGIRDTVDWWRAELRAGGPAGGGESDR